MVGIDSISFDTDGWTRTSDQNLFRSHLRTWSNGDDLNVAVTFYDFVSDFPSFDLEELREIMLGTLFDGMDLLNVEVVPIRDVRSVVSMVQGSPTGEAITMLSIVIPFADCFWSLQVQTKASASSVEASVHLAELKDRLLNSIEFSPEVMDLEPFTPNGGSQGMPAS